MRTGGALAGLLALALLPSAAHAGHRLAILPAVVAGPHGQASAGEVFEATVRGVGLRLDVEVMGYESLFLQGATSRVTEAGRCGSDEACIRRVLEDAGATLGLRSIVNFALDPPLVTLSLVSTDPTQPPAQSIFEAQGPWDQAVSTRVDALMLKRGLSPAGRLELSGADAVRVEFPSTPLAARESPTLFRLPPGQHTVVLHASDGRTVTQAVLITAHQDTSVAVVFPTAPPDEESEGSILSSAWFWGGVGLVVVGAATAAVIAADPFGGPGGPACLCVTTANGPCGTCP